MAKISFDTERSDNGVGKVSVHVHPACDGGEMFTVVHLCFEVVSGDLITCAGSEYCRGLQQTSFRYVVKKYVTELHNPTVAVKEGLSRLFKMYSIPKHVRIIVWKHVLNSHRLFDEYTTEYFAEHTAKMVRIPRTPKPLEFKTTALDSISDVEENLPPFLQVFDDALLDTIARGDVIIDNPASLVSDDIDIDGPYGLSPKQLDTLPVRDNRHTCGITSCLSHQEYDLRGL